MVLHNSLDPYYRSPLGAQPCLTELAIRLRCDEAARAVWLRLWWDDAEIKLPMEQEQPGVYLARFALDDHPGLLWYHFVLDYQDGATGYYGNAADHLGGEGLTYDYEPPGYQITVYDPAYDTPKWMRDGIMYHLMVDRFHASRPISERRPPLSGHWHKDWYELPELNIDPASLDNAADDFFGGDLRGIEQKLPYLKDLGVTVLYLSPIFQARSNHKYNTGDYMAVDPSFGTEVDFRSLCAAAKAQGIRVMLDGVFSHTGSDSRYFNREGMYDSIGAFQSQESPYASWYTFQNWPHKYECWWGFDTLPCVRKMDPSYLDFIIRGDDAVSAHWIRQGASGWRLDVADELPMAFLRMLRIRMRREDENAALLGEVWEDASCKIAYGELRCYCLGDTLDSAMNYPLREALFDFLLGRASSNEFARRLEHMHSNYPKPFFYSLMNLMGSHDKARAISVLSGAGNMEPSRAERSGKPLREADYRRGVKRMLLCWQMICALPGMPCLYYGDEAGMTGMSDPFCRGTYPWGREDAALLERMRDIIRARRAHEVWARGEMRLFAPHPDVIACVREISGGRDVFGEPARNARALCAINRSNKAVRVELSGQTIRIGPLSCVWTMAV